MSYINAGIYASQRRRVVAPAPDCPDYTMPAPTAVLVTLDETLVMLDPANANVHICEEIV